VKRDSVLPDTELTLAEVLTAHGYATGAFTANVLMRPQSGLAQGFDEYRVLVSPGDDRKPTAGIVNHAALAWLDGLRRGARVTPPVLLYLHYMEPHLPYTPPPAVLDRVLKGRPHPDLVELNNLTPVLQFIPDIDERLPGLWTATTPRSRARRHGQGPPACARLRELTPEALVKSNGTRGRRLSVFAPRRVRRREACGTSEVACRGGLDRQLHGVRRFLSEGGLPQHFKPQYGTNERYNYFWDRKGEGRQPTRRSSSGGSSGKS